MELYIISNSYAKIKVNIKILKNQIVKIYINCKGTLPAFGKLGENVSQYVSKGHRVLVEGRLSENRWEDNEGNQRSRMQIIANTVVFLSHGKKEQSGYEEHSRIEDPF